MNSILPQQRQALAKLIQRYHKARAGSLVDFIELTVSDDHGNKLRLAQLHRQWVAHLHYCWERELKAMIIAPFGHGKSSSLAVPLIAHTLGMDPNSRVKIITNDDASARKRTAAVKTIIDSPAYARIFPYTKPGKKWTDHEMYLQRAGHSIDPSVHARGVLTTGIGGRADFIVFDDAVDQKNAMDKAQRDKVLNLIESTWLSRLEPDGKVLYIGTPWHLDDATHHLQQRKGWCTLIHKVSEDCMSIEQELLGAIDNQYPLVKE